jgi:NADH dehydrogenase
VYAGDVARAVRTVVTASGGIARLYELGGPRSWAYREIIEMVLQHRGRRRWLVPVPMSWWGTAARMLSVLPSPPITRDQLELMRVNNEVHTELPSFDRLGVVPRKLEMLLPECLP